MGSIKFNFTLLCIPESEASCWSASSSSQCCHCLSLSRALFGGWNTVRHGGEEEEEEVENEGADRWRGRREREREGERKEREGERRKVVEEERRLTCSWSGSGHRERRCRRTAASS